MVEVVSSLPFMHVMSKEDTRMRRFIPACGEKKMEK